jgi:hypothetical protein
MGDTGFSTPEEISGAILGDADASHFDAAERIDGRNPSPVRGGPCIEHAVHIVAEAVR